MEDVCGLTHAHQGFLLSMSVLLSVAVKWVV